MYEQAVSTIGNATERGSFDKTTTPPDSGTSSPTWNLVDIADEVAEKQTKTDTDPQPPEDAKKPKQESDGNTQSALIKEKYEKYGGSTSGFESAREKDDTTVRQPLSGVLALPEAEFRALPASAFKSIDAQALASFPPDRLRMLTSDQLNGLLQSTYSRLETRHPGYEHTKSGAPRWGWEKGVSYHVRVSAPGMINFTPEQMSALTPTQISGLSNDNLRNLHPKHIAAMTTAHVKALSPGQIVTMQGDESRYRYSSLEYFTPSQARALSAEQLAVLNTKNRDLIETRALTGPQVAALTPERLIQVMKQISPEQVSSISSNQLKAIEPATLAKLFSPDQVRALSILQLESLPPAHLKAFLAGDNNMYKLSDEQWLGFTPKLVKAIPEEIVGDIISRRALERLQPNQLRQLTPAQLGQLSRYTADAVWIKSRTPAELAAIAPLNYRNPEPFYKLMWNSPLLTPQQFAALTPGQVRYLASFTDNQVEIMTAAQFRGITKPEKYLSESQRDSLKKRGIMK